MVSASGSASRAAHPSFDDEDYQRKRLLLEEYQYCNRKARRIVSKANRVYDMATSDKDPHMAAMRCDFKKLEAYLRDREG